MKCLNNHPPEQRHHAHIPNRKKWNILKKLLVPAPGGKPKNGCGIVFSSPLHRKLAIIMWLFSQKWSGRGGEGAKDHFFVLGSSFCWAPLGPLNRFSIRLSVCLFVCGSDSVSVYPGHLAGFVSIFVADFSVYICNYNLTRNVLYMWTARVGICCTCVWPTKYPKYAQSFE